MAKKVLLIYPKITSMGMNPWIPIGQLYIAALLEQHNIEVKIYDRNKETNNIIDFIKNYDPDHIGIGAMTVQAQDAAYLCTLIKANFPDKTISLGGVHFTFRPEDGIKLADMVILGEGEFATLELCQGISLSNIEGIVFKNDKGGVVYTNPRPFLNDLDSLPLPAYHLIDVTSYSDVLITGHKAISILTGRGCPYDCVFCASPGFWKRKVRFHSLENVVTHINFIVNKYGIRNIRLMDDTFTLSKKRVIDFCERVKPLNLNMTCLTSVKNADLDLFKIMKASGFSIVAFGVECGNQGVLDAINKGIKLEEVTTAISYAKEAGLLIELLFMIGNITETEETIKESIRFARKHNRNGSNWFQFATPFPGSQFSIEASNYGTITNWDWNAWHHQHPVFVPFGLTESKMIELRSIALAGKDI